MEFNKVFNLSEYGLYDENDKIIPLKVNSENDIFDFLDMKYLSPEERYTPSRSLDIFMYPSGHHLAVRWGLLDPHSHVWDFAEFVSTNFVVLKTASFYRNLIPIVDSCSNHLELSESLSPLDFYFLGYSCRAATWEANKNPTFLLGLDAWKQNGENWSKIDFGWLERLGVAGKQNVLQVSM